MNPDRIKHRGVRVQLNGNDAYVVLGLVFDSIEEDVSSKELLHRLRMFGYCACNTEFGCAACGGRFVVKDVDRYKVVNQYELDPSVGTLIATARSFGRKVRETQDKGLTEEHKRLRREFRTFCDAISKEWGLTALDAYYDEIRREPTDDEYEE